MCAAAAGGAARETEQVLQAGIAIVRVAVRLSANHRNNSDACSRGASCCRLWDASRLSAGELGSARQPFQSIRCRVRARSRSRIPTNGAPVSAARLAFAAMTTPKSSPRERVSCKSKPSMQMMLLA